MVIRTLYETLTMKKSHVKRQQLITQNNFTRKTQQYIYTQKPVFQNLRVRRTQLIDEHGHTHIIRNPHNEKKYHVKRQQLSTHIDLTRKTRQQHIYTQKLVTQKLRVRRTQLIEEPGHTHIIRNPHIEKNLMSNVNN